jgi:2-iminobutanoate/2-iminopropanoate deaminase
MDKTIINTPSAPKPIGPYSQATQFGNLIFISGQIPIDPGTNELIKGDIKKETHRVMKNIRAILHAAGADFSNVLKCSIFVKNMGDFGLVNESYGQYFQEAPPARETIEVSDLPKGVHVEISCIAAL